MSQNYPSEAYFDTYGNVCSAEDWLGNRFGVGDLVMYCISAGRGQMMAIGVVQAMRIKEYSKTTKRVDPNWKEGQPWHQRMMTVPTPQEEWVVEVQILTQRTSGHWNNQTRSRPAWVNEMNITAVTGIEDALS